MLYHLLYPLHETVSLFNVLRYLTFRSMMAFIVTLVLVLWFQPIFIQWFRKRQLGQPIRDDGPQRHLAKQGTPTMGGLVVVASVAVSTLLFADLTNIYVWTIIGVLLGYGTLGFVDDYIKVMGKNSKGIKARTKMAWQMGIAAVAVTVLLLFSPMDSFQISKSTLKKMGSGHGKRLLRHLCTFSPFLFPD